MSNGGAVLGGKGVAEFWLVMAFNRRGAAANASKHVRWLDYTSLAKMEQTKFVRGEGRAKFSA
jgi:hypothetical protein